MSFLDSPQATAMAPTSTAWPEHRPLRTSSGRISSDRSRRAALPEPCGCGPTGFSSLAPASRRGGKSVLVAFGDPAIRQQVGEVAARRAEAAVLVCGCLRHCRECLRERRVNALLLDMSLAEDGGLSFCAVLREEGFRAPILLFDSGAADDTAIRALDTGATDYLPMPFNPDVLAARLRAHLRQHDESDFVAYRVGPFEFQPGSRVLLDRESGRKVRLTGIETQIVRFLLQQPEARADREDLMQALWGACDQRTSHAIDSHVYRIRQKIEPNPKAPVHLLTEGRIYRLMV